jgi:rhodanese-related sulfurtransferase
MTPGAATCTDRLAAVAEVPEITVDALASALAGGAVLVDVRQPDEYVEGHVADARLIPLGDLPARAGEIPAVEPVYLICRSGARSHRAAEFLQSSGVHAVNVAGGMLAWADGGHPVVTGPSYS